VLTVLRTPSFRGNRIIDVAEVGGRERTFDLYPVEIRIIISGCDHLVINSTRDAAVKRVIFISCAAMLALLISIPSGADAARLGKTCARKLRDSARR
jgi:hypothetical protein